MTQEERQQLLRRYSPDAQYDMVNDEDEAFHGSYPTLSALKAMCGINMPVMWLLPQLYNLSEYCGCKDKLNERQMEECARIIANEYYYMKISELMLFFYRFKTGRYGRFYGSVDPMIITCALAKFASERIDAIRRYEDNQEAMRREQMMNDPERMSFDEWQEIKMLTRMYEMKLNK